MSGLSPELQSKVAAAAARGETRVSVVDSPALVAAVADARHLAAEHELQKRVEQMLEYHGWAKRTHEQIAAGSPRRGWQVHLHITERNPLLLDLLLLNNDGTWYEIELKGGKTRIAAHQRELVRQDSQRRGICYSWEDVAAFIGIDGSKEQ